MYDQSFSRRALERVLQKGDFHGIAAANQKAFKDAQLTDAETAASSTFNMPSNPLNSFLLKKKMVYRLPKLADELVVRKLCENLKRIIKSHNRGRAAIVGNLKLLLEEGVPYCVYRLDIKGFYESFETLELLAKIDGLFELSPQSKCLLKSLLNSHANLSGTGVPRGLSISANLSDLMMQNFDRIIFSDQNVFFYARYVDDIIIITSSHEDKIPFRTFIESSLPSGLKLNPDKKSIVHAKSKVSPHTNAACSMQVLSFDYLGYRFSVSEPAKQAKKQPGAHFRDVTVDIASAKIKKIKTRIVRSFLEFEKNSDWTLLFDRIKFLTHNFSIYDRKLGSRKLAGIYHSYPQVSDDASSLKELDMFLRNAILSKSGKLFMKTSLKLSAHHKRSLLAQSFASGHASKDFVYFSGLRISEIQKCWKN